MSQEEAFLVEIAEHPDDPAARLIYADWLDEHGDPRGEFIRIEEELNGLRVHSERRQALRARWDELRPRIDSDWLACLNYAPGYRPFFVEIPERRSDRWRVLEEFIQYWYGSFGPVEHSQEGDLQQVERRLGRFPEALREWYLLTARWSRIWSYRDEMVLPANLRVHEWDGALILRHGWGNVRWGIRRDELRQEDPPVYCFGAPYRYDATLASSSVSKFAMAVAVQNAMSAPAMYASGHLGRDPWALEELRPRLRRCALPFRDQSGSRAEYWEGPDLLAIESEARGWLYLVVRNEDAWEQLSPRVQSLLRRR